MGYMLPDRVVIACNDNQDGLMREGYFRAGDGMENLPFYTVMHPGTPGDELNWAAWAFGIDYWEGEPTLAYLSYYFWVP